MMACDMLALLAEGKLLKSGFGWFLFAIVLAGLICGIACR